MDSFSFVSIAQKLFNTFIQSTVNSPSLSSLNQDISWSVLMVFIGVLGTMFAKVGHLVFEQLKNLECQASDHALMMHSNNLHFWSMHG